MQDNYTIESLGSVITSPVSRSSLRESAVVSAASILTITALLRSRDARVHDLPVEKGVEACLRNTLQRTTA